MSCENNNKYVLSDNDNIVLEKINCVISSKYNQNNTDFDSELYECILYIHMSPNKEDICKNWIYGVEFLLIDSRHCNGSMFYQRSKGWVWKNSFCTDFLQQVFLITCLDRNINTEYLDILYRVNKKIRIDLNACMEGSYQEWDSILGDDFQKILDLEESKRDELLNLWKYKKDFMYAIMWNSGCKEYFTDKPNIKWITSFVTSFMMAVYH
jgi:hypothetical protein